MVLSLSTRAVLQRYSWSGVSHRILRSSASCSAGIAVVAPTYGCPQRAHLYVQTLGEKGKAYRLATELEYKSMRGVRADWSAQDKPEVRKGSPSAMLAEAAFDLFCPVVELIFLARSLLRDTARSKRHQTPL